MSAFAPINVMGANQQKRQLIQRLTEQYQQNAGRFAGLNGPAIAGAGLPSARPFGGAGRITGAMPNLVKTLIDRLGPGGYGHPIVGRDSSPGLGVDVGRSLAPNPHSGSVLDPGGSGSTIPVAGAQAPQAPSSPSSLGPVTVDPNNLGAANAQLASGGATSIVGPTHTVVDPGFNMASSSPIDLGNGLVYDPSTGQVRPAVAPPAQGSAPRNGVSQV